MNKQIRLIFSVLFIVVLFGVYCKDQSNQSPPPAKVQLVTKTAENDPVEHGIDAIPEKDAIFLEWHPNTEKNLAGYIVYRSEVENSQFVEVGKITKYYEKIDTTFTDSLVALNTRYYYFVRAFDDLNQIGDPSDTVSYKLWVKPVLFAPVGAISDPTTIVFIWEFNASFVPNTFVFRIERLGSSGFTNFFTQDFSLGDDYTPHQEWEISKLPLSSPLPTGMYRWRIDPIGNEPLYGAESNWMMFAVQ